MTGIITDIHRTSVVDGPGLRTTVFLKGCPMRCLWCHNPETQSHRIQLAFDSDKCTGCGDCIDVCPTSALSLNNGKATLDRALCTDCGECVSVCPSGALFLYGKEISSEAVVAEVVKDRAYYESSGGGVTISGGDPMAQPDFALALLGECKKLGIHTALDTTGLMPAPLCERTMNVTDLYLFDYKATDEGLHEKLTGAPRQQILENLRRLVSSGKSVILRCPIIPDVNDHPAHLTAISEMENLYPSLAGIDLLTWHTMGNAKYGRLGRRPAAELPPNNVSEEQKNHYRDFFAVRGNIKIRVV